MSENRCWDAALIQGFGFECEREEGHTGLHSAHIEDYKVRWK